MFGVSVSGLKGAQKHLDVTSNNIANANSYGFKKSRAEFADIYAGEGGKTAVGMGVTIPSVSQQFAQGGLTGDTGNTLDMAIQGEGFFVLSQEMNAGGGAALTFTRNGAFQVNDDGYIVTAMGDFVQGWDVGENGSATTLDLNSTHAIQLPTDTGAPSGSSSIGIGVNLPAGADSIFDNYTPDLTGDDPLLSGSTGTWSTGIQAPDGSANWDPSMGIPRNADGSVDTDGLSSDPQSYSFLQYLTNFDPKDATTYTSSTSQTIHDSLGNAHTLTYYMLKLGDDGANNTKWAVVPFVDGQPVDIAPSGDEKPTMITNDADDTHYMGFTMTFDANGELAQPGGIVPENLQLLNPNVGGGTGLRESLATAGGFAANDKTFDGYDNTDLDGTLASIFGPGVEQDQAISIDFTKSTQYGSSTFNVSTAPWNDGYATGLLLGVTVSEDGILQCEYSNGRKVNIAKLAMADFTNPQGLTKVGDTQWKQSLASGEAIAKEANSGSAGKIIGSNLEMSNVDLTTELVELISAQRNYQANSQALQTQTTIMDTILNIR